MITIKIIIAKARTKEKRGENEHLASISITRINNRDLDSSTLLKVSVILLTLRKTKSGFYRTSSTISRVYM